MKYSVVLSLVVLAVSVCLSDGQSTTQLLQRLRLQQLRQLGRDDDISLVGTGLSRLGGQGLIGSLAGQRSLLGPLSRRNLLGQRRLISSLSGRNSLGRRLGRLGQRRITPLSPLSRLVGGRRSTIGLSRRGLTGLGTLSRRGLIGNGCTCSRRCLAGIRGDICLLDVDLQIVGRVCCPFPLAPFSLG